MNSIWIARDKDGDLFAFLSEPTRYEETGEWAAAGERNASMLLDSWFPELTWDDEPLEFVPKERMDV